MGGHVERLLLDSERVELHGEATVQAVRDPRRDDQRPRLLGDRELIGGERRAEGPRHARDHRSV